MEANESANADLSAAVNEAVKLGATEISNSYGSGEETGEEAAYNHPGVVITASAGDEGYYGWDEVFNEGPPAYPKSRRYRPRFRPWCRSAVPRSN